MSSINSKNSEKSGISVRSFIIALVIFLIAHIVMSVAIIDMAKKALREQVEQRMLDVANTAAHMINGDELKKLKAEHKGSPEYQKVYDTLRSFQDSIQLDYIYGIQQLDDGSFAFTIDPEPVDPGEWGEEIDTTDALVNASKGKADVDKEPCEDEWGLFYSAYSPIFDSDGNVVGIVGVDFNAEWYDKMLDTRKLVLIIMSMVVLTTGTALAFIVHTFMLEMEKKVIREKFEQTLQREQEQEQELGSARHLAYTDPLTGVKNKHAYLEAIERINKGLADGSVKEFGVIVFDLNGLKLINDTYGHDEGDNYIKTGCALICSRFCHSPVFRIGGDEFTVILEGSDYNDRQQLLSEFDRVIEQNQSIGAVVVSTGLEIYDRQRDGSFSDVFERADKKMYERKCYLKSMK